MASNWKRAAISTLLVVAITAVYWLVAIIVSVFALMIFFGDYGAGHSEDVAYMQEMGHEVAIGRWIIGGVATAGYCATIAAVVRAKWFRGR